MAHNNWHTKDGQRCENCGHRLMAHENQVRCPNHAQQDAPTDAVYARLHEIAYRDSAKAVTVRADDLRALLARYAPAQDVERERDAPYLQEADQHALHRFIETCEDGEGYNIGKDRIKRLAELGVVSNHGFGRYGVTAFGYWAHEHYWHQHPALPLMTNSDRDAAARAQRAAERGDA